VNLLYFLTLTQTSSTFWAAVSPTTTLSEKKPTQPAWSVTKTADHLPTKFVSSLEVSPNGCLSRILPLPSNKRSSASV
jgi:hypothetical protein